MDNFIERKFKNIEKNKNVDIVGLETNETVTFQTIVDNSRISIILGEPASGKTYQLKEYAKNKNSKFFLLKMLSKYKKKDIEEYDILLFDSIDEALLKNKDDDELIFDLLKFIEKYKKKKIIITCRYLEWKENFEEKLKEVDKELKVYDIQELSRDDINLLLKGNEVNEFWDFIGKNHLELLLKNIMIVKHLTSNFNKEYQQKNISYIDIYKKIVEQSIKSKGTKREHKQDKRKVKKLFPIGASLATYMTLNRKDTVLNENINDIENFVDELYQVENKDIKDNDLKKILDTALFEKKENDFSFFHKSIQEYLTAYFTDCKKLDSKTIKKIFSHDLKFCEEFEEVIIYLTNIQPELFDDFVDFDPFIFRRHPSLTKEQQEKLLLSIIDKIKDSQAYAWNRENFFHNTSLVKFDKIDNIYTLIKDKDIINSQNDMLFQYIIRVFAENYSKEFEEFIFELLSTVVEDKFKCRMLINDGYHVNIDHCKLFDFMKENKLFLKKDELSNNYDNQVEISLFYWMIREKESSENILFLLNYLEPENFKEMLPFLYQKNMFTIDTVEEWFIYFMESYIDLEGDLNSTLEKNIKHIVDILLSQEKVKVLDKIIMLYKSNKGMFNDYVF